MSDNETNLAKWTAFARSSDHEAVGHTLNEMAREIGRLRCVCRLASQAITDDIRNAGIDGVTKRQLVLLATDLANEGSKDGNV